MGLGLAAIGRPGYINLGHKQDLNAEYDPEQMKSHAHELFDEAWKSGIRCFDAARSYGKGEEFLGEWLRSKNPSGAVINSKWGYEYTAGWRVEAEKHEVKEHSLEQFNRQWPQTKKNLGGFLNLYQIHSATLESGVLQNRPVLEKLYELKQSGIRIGLSLSGPRQSDTLEAAMKVTVDHERLFDSVQATFNILEQSADAALHEAHKLGMQVIVKECLANGRLTERGNVAQDRPALSKLQEISKQLSLPVDAIALAFVLHQPWADVVLSGAATISQLKSNLKAFETTLPDEVLHEFGGLAGDSNVYWKARSGLNWN